jgi:hypothetical protein
MIHFCNDKQEKLRFDIKQRLEDQILALMNAMVKGEPLYMYKESAEFTDSIPWNPLGNSLVPHFKEDYFIINPFVGSSATREKAYYGDDLIGEIISFKNDTKETHMLHESYFVTSGVLAVGLQKSL